MLRPSTPRLREHKALLAFMGLEPEFTVKQLNAMPSSELSLKLKLTARQLTAVGYIAGA